VAATTEPWVGARALWRPTDISEVVVALGEPGGVGLSAIAGLLDPVARDEPWGLRLKVVPPEVADTVVRVPLAPGLVVPVGVSGATRVAAGETVTVGAPAGSLALDGERELELAAPAPVEIRLDTDGPWVIDVEAVMREAARGGLLQGAA
jgi:hypothetical protein